MIATSAAAAFNELKATKELLLCVSNELKQSMDPKSMLTSVARLIKAAGRAVLEVDRHLWLTTPGRHVRAHMPATRQ